MLLHAPLRRHPHSHLFSQVVEYSRSDSEFPGGSGGSVPEGKVEAVFLECDYLLRVQLETQRHYYEQELASISKVR